ncbi:hypothetical protein [Marinobacterium aestuariivivens]|uniref:hypothetical protein n=1 Tax=Marinobacterium aestuariivivens TaxID=1698799 RepID=UPI0036D33D85
MGLAISPFPVAKRAEADAKLGGKLLLRQTEAMTQFGNVNLFRAMNPDRDGFTLFEGEGFLQSLRDALECVSHGVSPMLFSREA